MAMQRKWVALLILAAFLVVAALFGYGRWRHAQWHVETEDAYVRGHIFSVASRISGTLLTLDGVGDAGVNPGQAPYLKFVENANTNSILYDADPALFTTNPNPWPSATQVFAFAANQSPANWNTDWLLASAGNYWSPDTVVGETLAGLQAYEDRSQVVDLCHAGQSGRFA